MNPYQPRELHTAPEGETIPTLATPPNRYIFTHAVYRQGDGERRNPTRQDAFEHLEIKSYGTPA
jgi:hypothetical protein